MKKLPFSAISVLSLVTGATAAPVTWNNTSTILPAATIGQEAHMPLLLWLIFFGVASICFFISLTPRKSTITELHMLYAGLSFFFFSLLSVTSLFVQHWTYDTAVVQLNESCNLIVQPVVYALPGWITLIMVLLTLLSVFNLYWRSLDVLQEETEDIRQGEL